MPKEIALHELASVLPKSGRVLVQGTSGESRLLADSIMAAGEEIGALTFTGIFVPCLNMHSYLANSACRVETFFMTPELKAAPSAQVEFLPLCYNAIRERLLAVPIDAALFMCSPPDEDGNCSFGPAVDFLAEIWPQIPVKIAQINDKMPQNRGNNGIPYAEITAFVAISEDFGAEIAVKSDEIAVKIANHVASCIKDGATIQTGLGKVPGAILKALRSRRNLRIHSGLIGDEVLDLLEAGALASGTPITAGVAIGSKRLYDAISGPAFQFCPVAITHNAARIAAIANFVSINSAIEVDLLGQAYAELGPKGLMSGPGGASDFAKGAGMSAGGLRIVALPASAAKGAISRIVPAGKGAGPVSLSRMDIDIVATEFGTADLRGLGYCARAETLIAIAAPEHREALAESWAEYEHELTTGERISP